MSGKVLVGYDGSPPADAAFDVALDLAGTYDAELHILAVAPPPEIGAVLQMESEVEESRRRLEEMLWPVRMRAANASVRYRFHVAVGDPFEQMARYAQDHGINHIVVGHHAHARLQKWLIGAVTRRMIAEAPCAVTIVPA